MKTRTQKTLCEMTESAVLAMVLDDMEFLGLIGCNADADKEPTIVENTQQQASGGLVLAERGLSASFTERRSLADQVRQLLEEAAPQTEPSR